MKLCAHGMTWDLPSVQRHQEDHSTGSVASAFAENNGFLYSTYQDWSTSEHGVKVPEGSVSLMGFKGEVYTSEVVATPLGQIIAITTGAGRIELRTFHKTQEYAERDALLAWYHAQYPELEVTAAGVPFSFWCVNGRGEGAERARHISVSSWDSIAANYPTEIRNRIEPLMSPTYVPDSSGKIVLWRGLPGTGKTWAIRALAHSWNKWAKFNYIMDPEQFFARPSYMLSVLMEGNQHYMELPGATLGRAEKKWDVLVLEDVGELLGASAARETGQGLSRLLNLADGMIGQGLRLLILMTTNEDLGKIHPAVVRPGRCLSSVEFSEFDSIEAEQWMEARGATGWHRAMTLAEMYAKLAGRETEQRQQVLGFTT